MYTKDDITTRRHRAAVITRGISYRGDGTIGTARPGVEVDLMTILTTTLTRFEPESAIVIDGPPLAAFTGQSDAVRAAGWHHGPIGAWTLFYRSDGRVVSVGIRAAFGPQHLGVLFTRQTDPGALAIILDRYQAIIGTAWRGTFATTACAAIRSTWGNSRYQPYWNEGRKGPGHAVGPMVWSREMTHWERHMGFVHTVDANSAYLGAAVNAELAWSELHHVGEHQFDPNLPGYWHIQLDTSTLEMCADPTRPPIFPPGRVRDCAAWVTTPYAKFLRDSLGDRVEVIDSWTATAGQRPNGSQLHPAGSRVLRKWGEQIRDARTAIEAMPGGPIRAALLTAVKRSYKDAVGAMQRDVNGKGMRVHRPIWGHTIVDGWRAQLYRTILRVRQSAGLWPIAVRTDSLAYADQTDDPRAVMAEIGGARTGLGGWKHQDVVTTEEWIDAHRPKARATR